MKKLLMLGMPLAAILLGACGEKTGAPEPPVVSETNIENKEEKVTVGFVTAVEEGFIQIDFGGEFQLRYETNTSGIEIGTRVEVLHEGEISEKNFIDVLINKGGEVDGNLQKDGEGSKNVVYLDKNGNLIQNVEEFLNNIKKSNEEVVEVVEVDETVVDEAVVDEKEVVEFHETPEDEKYQEMKIVYLGKADSRTIEVLVNGEVRIMNLENDSLLSKLDKFNLEDEITVMTYEANNSIIIHSIN